MGVRAFVSGNYLFFGREIDRHGHYRDRLILHKATTGHETLLDTADLGIEESSSVAADGTLFFVRSGPGCGDHARLMEFKNGSVTLVRDFAKNRDSFETYAVSPTQVVRQVNNCKNGNENVNLTTIS